MKIWMWKPGRKLVSSCKSGSGGQGSNFDVFNVGHNKSTIGFRRLTRSCKSVSGGQGSKTHVFNQGANMNIKGFRRLARS